MSNIKYIEKESIFIFRKYDPSEADLKKKEMLQAYNELSRTEDQKKEVARSFKDSIDSLKSKLDDLIYCLDKNGEDTKIQAALFIDFDNKIKLWKNAKGEVVRELPFQDEDYNRPMPLLESQPDFDEEIEDIEEIEEMAAG